MSISPIVVGISGGSGSGKTLFLRKLMGEFTDAEVSLLSLDNYYKDRNQQPKDEKGVENFDMPESIDSRRFFKDLARLKSGEDIDLLEYTFNNKDKKAKVIKIKSAPVIVVEGIFTFYFKEISSLLDLKIFIEAPDYLMLTRRITRDAKERGYDLADVLYRFQHHVTPSFKKYIEPLKMDADIIIPNHKGFAVGLNVVTTFLRSRIHLPAKPLSDQ